MDAAVCTPVVHAHHQVTLWSWRYLPGRIASRSFRADRSCPRPNSAVSLLSGVDWQCEFERSADAPQTRKAEESARGMSPVQTSQDEWRGRSEKRSSQDRIWTAAAHRARLVSQPAGLWRRQSLAATSPQRPDGRSLHRRAIDASPRPARRDPRQGGSHDDRRAQGAVPAGPSQSAVQGPTSALRPPRQVEKIARAIDHLAMKRCRCPHVKPRHPWPRPCRRRGATRAH